MNAPDGRRVRSRIVLDDDGNTHVEYRVGDDRYQGLDSLEAMMEGR